MEIIEIGTNLACVLSIFALVGIVWIASLKV